MDECFREDEGIYTIRSVLIFLNFQTSLLALESLRGAKEQILKITTVYILTNLFQSGKR